MKTTLLLLLFLVFSNLSLQGQTCPPGPPPSRYNGTTPGTPIAGGRQYNFEYALLGGFDCWEQLKTWFPAYLESPNSVSPKHIIVDMAYAVHGAATFSNVFVPSNGNYTLTIRYAFNFGAFPRVTDRPEGVRVNGVVVTYDMHFPITYSFEDYDCSSLLVPLHAGRNTIEIFNVSNRGIARADTMMVTSSGSPACKDTAPAAVN
jgi:hypothetical protein